ncbi:MAG: hypothetical protein PHN42_00830 [Bacilli bacterium]|nr:hypothetical protein [Bacilli bacterium]
MTITIMHLYYDILNLYGENGNVKALKMYFETLGIDVKIKFVTINDTINLKDVDLIYLGMGTEQNQKLVIEHIKKYKNQFQSYIENDGYLLSTGNSFELFGKNIIDKNNINYDTLGIFEFVSHEENFRLVDEALCKTSFSDNYIIGFINRNSVIKNISDNYLFEIVKGIGNYPKNIYEGYHYKNFYGTYLIGPLLVRNPHFLEVLANKIIKDKDNNFKINKNNLEIEKKAYNEFMNNYYVDFINKN